MLFGIRKHKVAFASAESYSRSSTEEVVLKSETSNQQTRGCKKKSEIADDLIIANYWHFGCNLHVCKQRQDEIREARGRRKRWKMKEAAAAEEEDGRRR